MKAVLTRVTSASVTVDGEVVGAIDCPDTGGLLALVGVGRDDAPEAWETMVRKIAELRILDGEASVEDAGAPVLVVSQFTLMGATKKGRRPSWTEAAPGDIAEPVVDKIVEGLRNRGIQVATGSFGAMMKVASVNDGPFTVLVEC
ncbi:MULTISPECIES: D-aminoacyl-tRNA deacylase [unclassified Corynebacterium]|uniref:D-aminoacyl-tRNA deacylase n=1 Tax=unclassified Corynebacterium TaxID=2624378 RepID=UPI0030AFD412